MEINGITVDTEAIAAGLYDIICQCGQDHIVAFGMIPNELMQLVQTQLRDKVITDVAAKWGVTVDQARPLIDDVKLDATVKVIMHDIAVQIITVAKNQGKLVV